MHSDHLADVLERARRIEAIAPIDLFILEALEVVVTAIDELIADIEQLKAAAGAENTELGDLAAAFDGVSTKLAALENQIASGGTVTADQLHAIAADVTSVVQTAQAAVSAAQSATGVDEPAPPPTGGPAPAADVAPGETSGADAAQEPGPEPEAGSEV